MSLFDTNPVALDETGHRRLRRMSDQKLQEWANSAVLKLLQYFITGIAVPIAGFMLSSMGARLSNIEAAINNNAVQNATVDLRLKAAEAAALRVDTLERLQRLNSETNIKQDYEIQRVKDMLAQPRK